MKKYKFVFLIFIVVCFSLLLPVSKDFRSVLKYRNVYPYKVGSWITSIAVPETDNQAFKYTWYIGTRNGGVWKTINNGNTYFPVFDSVGIGSIGAVAVSKSNPEYVWVGTGEAYNARSSHAGAGVYFSPDGGKTWQDKGLEDTQHIAAIIINPTNPNIVYVAAMGHLFTPNKDRGIFKTTNGGKTWKKVLYIDENTGVIDMIMDSKNPNILYASTYEKYRYPWHFEAGGKNSAIYKTTNGGETWEKLKNGLPKGKLGRIGLALCYNHPNIVYAVVENLNPKSGAKIKEDVSINHMRDPYYDQFIGGEVYRSEDSGEHWKKMNQDKCNVSSKAAYSFNKIMVHPDNPDRISISSDLLITSLDGGKTFIDCKWPPKKYFVNMFGDIRTMWVDPKDGNHMMIGSDGGLFISYDGGKHMIHHDNIPLGEIYTVNYDDSYPYNIYLGIQDHDGWKGPSNDWSGRIGAEDWSIIGMWDGMYTAVDHSDNRWVYITTQFGGHRRVDQMLGKRYNIEPVAPKGEKPYRFAWTPPIVISPHNHKIIYTGGQYLLRSLDQGEHWEKISPDLTTNNAKKIAGKGHIMYCTITTISESPIESGVIWVGTDDGKVHLTKNYGKTWIEITQKFTKLGVPKEYRITRVLASNYKIGRAYVAISGFKYDDFTPYLFITDDFGKTWKKITNGLSKAPVNVIIEDPKQSNLLYAGNDKGVFISFNKGKKWIPLKLNMPIVPVNDLKIQPRENDLIVGTYGRGAFICDISLLQQINDNIYNKELYLFDIEPKPQRNYSEMAYWGNYEFLGDNILYTPNEPNGLVIYYWLKKSLNGKGYLSITDNKNNLVYKKTVENRAGFNRIVWNTYKAKPGKYKIKLIYGKFSQEKIGIVKPSPQWSVGNSNLPFYHK